MKTLYKSLSDPKTLFLLVGPCVVESEALMDTVGTKLVEIQAKYDIPIVLKGSYRKANRSRIDSFTGIGDERALTILRYTGEKFNLPTITDIHTEEEAVIAADYVDVLQIPAFLCRQTNLLVAAAKTNRIINIKKGQFLSPEAMEFAAKKVADSGNEQILLTERGVSFGYHDLVVDMRSIPIMQALGYPVVMDVTHALQRPNQTSGVTGGTPQFIDTLASAAVAAGVNGLFIETHPNPHQAKSDGANMLHLDQLESLISKVLRIKKAIL